MEVGEVQKAPVEDGVGQVRAAQIAFRKDRVAQNLPMQVTTSDAFTADAGGKTS